MLFLLFMKPKMIMKHWVNRACIVLLHTFQHNVWSWVSNLFWDQLFLTRYFFSSSLLIFKALGFLKRILFLSSNERNFYNNHFLLVTILHFSYFFKTFKNYCLCPFLSPSWLVVKRNPHFEMQKLSTIIAIWPHCTQSLIVYECWWLDIDHV